MSNYGITAHFDEHLSTYDGTSFYTYDDVTSYADNVKNLTLNKAIVEDIEHYSGTRVNREWAKMAIIYGHIVSVRITSGGSFRVIPPRGTSSENSAFYRSRGELSWVENRYSRNISDGEFSLDIKTEKACRDGMHILGEEDTNFADGFLDDMWACNITCAFQTPEGIMYEDNGDENVSINNNIISHENAWSRTSMPWGMTDLALDVFMSANKDEGTYFSPYNAIHAYRRRGNYLVQTVGQETDYGHNSVTSCTVGKTRCTRVAKTEVSSVRVYDAAEGIGGRSWVVDQTTRGEDSIVRTSFYEKDKGEHTASVYGKVGSDLACVVWKSKTRHSESHRRTIQKSCATFNRHTGKIVDFFLELSCSGAIVWNYDEQDFDPYNVKVGGTSDRVTGLDIISEGVAGPGLLMLNSIGPQLKGKDYTNINEWKICDQFEKLLENLNGALDDERYSELSASPNSHARSMFRAKEDLWISLGLR